MDRPGGSDATDGKRRRIGAPTARVNGLADEPPLWRARVETIDGKRSEYYEIELSSPANAEREWQLILVPGNPGIAEYYKTTALRTALCAAPNLDLSRHKISIKVLNYMGFNRVKPPQLFTIREEGEQMSRLLKFFVDQAEARDNQPARHFKFVLCGHSIGSHCCKLIMESEVADFVQASVFLMPFIRVDHESAHQKRARFLANHPLAWFAVQALQQLTPVRILEGMTDLLVSDMDELCLDITKRYFVAFPWVLKSVAHMGSSEFEDLSFRDEEPFLSNELDFYAKNSQRIFFIYTQNDFWAPLHQAEKVKSALHNVVAPEAIQVEILDPSYGIKHDFVTDDRQVQIMADKIARKFVCQTVE
ncbi:hypothetical protein FVE85_5202 [Porphyridium purpureum]|uniref:Lipid droplet-associated hydrolase n=1 Tax=Porphyridium purpureum TaxID=35688 RepID=A0A5J4Z4U9_PORPP|nr:hypothetical protein FVE85_5202 [Porphyridium purpureum]|eukprot:POR8478..scf295_1